MNTEAALEQIGIRIPEFLLPAPNVDLTKWAVIACDQFTSDPGYWQSVDEYVGSDPSAYHLILPEAYLEAPDKKRRIKKIHAAMKEYLHNGTLVPAGRGGMLVKRETPYSPPRWGLVAALDLEQYDYSSGSESMVRATEGTIIERIPPRRAIREGAALELPHIMVLIDDKDEKVIRPLTEECGSLEVKYDFPLMFGGGRITGYFLPPSGYWDHINTALRSLGNSDSFLYAMGDGNHSLAAAKTVWEEIKRKDPGNKGPYTHPARWALVEIVNLYEQGIVFHPIHRIVSGISPEQIISSLRSFGWNIREAEILPSSAAEEHVIAAVIAGRRYALELSNPDHEYAVESLDAALARYLTDAPGAVIDYIHEEETVNSAGSRPDGAGFFLPVFKKEDLFPAVSRKGALPRKSFSIGYSREKRYYLEARRIS